MKIGFDIGGVLSKYPTEFYELIGSIGNDGFDRDIYCITDQHPKDTVLQTLKENGFYGQYWFNENNVYCADYEKFGNMAKAILIKELGIDIFIDDFEAYLSWDSTLGPQPILLKLMPDVFKPYWSTHWKQEGGNFGRKMYYGNDSKT